MLNSDFQTNQMGPKHSVLELGEPMSCENPQLICSNFHNGDRKARGLLQLAVAADDESLIKNLLRLESSSNDMRLNGLNPLQMAIKFGSENTLQMLLDHGFEVDIKDMNGRTLLHLIACLNYRDNSLMTRMAKSILKKADNVKILLNQYAHSGDTALHYAVIFDNDELVKLFLMYGANIHTKNTNEKTSLFLATEFNRVKILKSLLLYGARVNDRMSNGQTSLHIAIKNRAIKCIELLLNHGTEVNAKDVYGETPLHLTVRLNYLDEKTMISVVRLLLNKGANVDAHTSSGETAFQCAIANGNEKLVNLFLEFGANVNVRNLDGKSPLHFAIQYSNQTIVNLLLDKGAAIDELTNDGKRALHVAVAVEDENMVRILLDREADVNAIDKSGKTPLSLAFEVAHMRSIYNPWNGFWPNPIEARCDNNIFRLLIKYIARLTNVCEENLRMISCDEKLKEFYEDCLKELTVMRECKLCDNVSLYRVLTGHIDLLVNYARNENLVTIFEVDLCAHMFPIYYQILKDRFCKAESKRRLLDLALINFSSLIRPFTMPNLALNKIFSFLSTEDLVNVITA
ncbi:hypothetical protein QAD02_019362 [Eretmocerus hayati]|uniref:Uncharacterized protein n=1 Tax=Eretmocerus hayati TaxID=131215 RepID=A0ACC2PJG9_9HYME|nr:hypothetical protein QAD02_019362 [Eretmocerus hayati]